MNENDLRDAFAMFALIGVSSGTDMEHQAKWCYKMADAMIEARKAEPEQEIGIVAAKTRRKKND